MNVDGEAVELYPGICYDNSRRIFSGEIYEYLCTPANIFVGCEETEKFLDDIEDKQQGI